MLFRSRVTRPYESLSFVPTVLELIGATRGGRLSEDAKAKGFRPLPGEIAWEVFDERALAR